MRTEARDRVRLVFTLFDVDGSGDLEADDFDQMAARVVAVADGSTKAAKDAMVRAFQRYWATLAEVLDTDRDERVTYDEYQACVLSPERFDGTVREFAETLSALGDPDGDGLIERPRFTALMTAIGFARPNIDALFDALGPTFDDRIAVADWLSAIIDFYQPDMAGIAGDKLVPTTT